MIRTLIAFTGLAAAACASSAAEASDPAIPPALDGLLVLDDMAGRYVVVPDSYDAPLVGISQPHRGPGDGPEADGLNVIAWRADVSGVRIPADGGSATITNQHGDCLTVLSPEDIRWRPCRGGATQQVWKHHGGALIAAAPYQGFLDSDPGLWGGKFHIVRGEARLMLVRKLFGPVID